MHLPHGGHNSRGALSYVHEVVPVPVITELVYKRGSARIYLTSLF